MLSAALVPQKLQRSAALAFLWQRDAAALMRALPGRGTRACAALIAWLAAIVASSRLMAMGAYDDEPDLSDTVAALVAGASSSSQVRPRHRCCRRPPIITVT